MRCETDVDILVAIAVAWMCYVCGGQNVRLATTALAVSRGAGAPMMLPVTTCPAHARAPPAGWDATALNVRARCFPSL